MKKKQCKSDNISLIVSLGKCKITSILKFFIIFSFLVILNNCQEESKKRQKPKDMDELLNIYRNYTEKSRIDSIEMQAAIKKNEIGKAQKILSNNLNELHTLKKKNWKLIMKYRDEGNYDYADKCLILFRELEETEKALIGLQSDMYKKQAQ